MLSMSCTICRWQKDVMNQSLRPQRKGLRVDLNCNPKLYMNIKLRLLPNTKNYWSFAIICSKPMMVSQSLYLCLNDYIVGSLRSWTVLTILICFWEFHKIINPSKFYPMPVSVCLPVNMLQIFLLSQLFYISLWFFIFSYFISIC